LESCEAGIPSDLCMGFREIYPYTVQEIHPVPVTKHEVQEMEDKGKRDYLYYFNVFSSFAPSPTRWLRRLLRNSIYDKSGKFK